MSGPGKSVLDAIEALIPEEGEGIDSNEIWIQLYIKFGHKVSQRAVRYGLHLLYCRRIAHRRPKLRNQYLYLKAKHGPEEAERAAQAD